MGLGDRDYYRPSGFGGFSFLPPVIKQLLIINGAVFFLSLIAKNIVIGNILLDDWLVLWFGLIPLGFQDATFLPWQLITYQFLHGSFTHVLFNMFMLWMFGMEIENLWGSKKFLIFYLLCGVGAGLFQLLIAPMFGSVGPTIGASGAVYGVMVAFAMFFPDRYIYIYFLLPVKAKYLIAILMVFEFMSVGDMSLVAHLAHIGGALTALVYILLERRSSFDLNKVVNQFKKTSNSFSSSSSTKFRKPMGFGKKSSNVEEADFYDINSEDDNKITQEEIDKILDKISQSGYQNLTEREKRILFEASKRD
ncbi:MAG: rhomboid family intramembrane serine protease [Bacteroidetes bacterium]|nr:rhomboid family intramembrane serine protease [Bacteroidota bacterium]